MRLFKRIILWAIIVCLCILGFKFADNLVNGKVMQKGTVVAEDGSKFKYIDRKGGFPQEDYRLFIYPFKSKWSYRHDSGIEFDPKVSVIMQSDDNVFYLIHDCIIKYDKNTNQYNATELKYLDSIDKNRTIENYQIYIPVAEKLISDKQWSHIYDCSEFLLKQKSKIALDIVKNFEQDNKDKVDRSVSYGYCAIGLSYDDMKNKCKNLLEKYEYTYSQ